MIGILIVNTLFDLDINSSCITSSISLS